MTEIIITLVCICAVFLSVLIWGICASGKRFDDDTELFMRDFDQHPD